MGYPMAGHLARAGHDVTVFNRTTGRAEAWQSDYGGHVASTPAAAAKDQDAVMLCVGNDDDVREVTLGERGALSSMREGALLVDHTTTSEALATSLAASANQSGVAFLDAPVSGGQIGAENGVLTVMVGADRSLNASRSKNRQRSETSRLRADFLSVRDSGWAHQAT